MSLVLTPLVVALMFGQPPEMLNPDIEEAIRAIDLAPPKSPSDPLPQPLDMPPEPPKQLADPQNPPAWLGDPAAELSVAAGYAERLAADPVARDRLPHLRFFSAYNEAPEARDGIGGTLNFVVNSLSLQNPSFFLDRIGPSLWAVDIRDPGWSAESWEKLATEQSYFKANWLPYDLLVRLASRTGTSTPVVRADEFIAKATTAPLYYDFLGLPQTQSELLAILGVSLSENERRLAALAGNVTENLTVTQHNRRLVRYKGIRYLWISYDVTSNRGDQNVLRRLGRPLGDDGVHSLRIAGNELIFELGNGLHGYFLNNAAGARVDFVPPDIARDKNFADGLVRAGRSCMACHEEGINPFADDLTSLIEGGTIQLRTATKRAQQEIESFYDQRRLQPLIRIDNIQYGIAVSRVAGVKPVENASRFRLLAQDYIDGRVSLRKASIEMGMAEDRVVGLAREAVAAAKLTPTNDPSISLLLVGRTVARDAWEESFFGAMILRDDVKVKILIPHERILSRPKPTSAVEEIPLLPTPAEIPPPSDPSLMRIPSLKPGEGVYTDITLFGDQVANPEVRVAPESSSVLVTAERIGGKIRVVLRREGAPEMVVPEWVEILVGSQVRRLSIVRL
jgi:hypothetical protein